MKIFPKILDIFAVVSDVIKDQWNRINIDKVTAKFELKPDGSNTLTTFDPGAPDGTTAYILDTETEQNIWQLVRCSQRWL